MIAKATIGTFAASSFIVLVPFAAAAAAVVLVIVLAVAWMSAVHGTLVLFARRDDTDVEDDVRLAVARRLRAGARDA